MVEFPRARRLFLDTSNVLKWKNSALLKDPSVEVETCIKTVMRCWHAHQKDDLSNQEALCIACNRHRDRIPDSERSNVIVSAKLFLFTDDHESIRQAVNKTLERLDLEDMETLVVSLSPELSKGALIELPTCLGPNWARIPQNTAHSLLKIWPVLEEFVESNKIFRLGVSDMPVGEMEALFAAVRIPPQVNQIFSCSPSRELDDFAREHRVQLLTHHDSADVLPEEKLQSLMRHEFSSEDAAGWRPSWLMRYVEYYRNQRVVRSKGYTLFGERELSSPLPVSILNSDNVVAHPADGDQHIFP